MERSTTSALGFIVQDYQVQDKTRQLQHRYCKPPIYTTKRLPSQPLECTRGELEDVPPVNSRFSQVHPISVPTNSAACGNGQIRHCTTSASISFVDHLMICAVSC